MEEEKGLPASLWRSCTSCLPCLPGDTCLLCPAACCTLLPALYEPLNVGRRKESAKLLRYLCRTSWNGRPGWEGRHELQKDPRHGKTPTHLGAGMEWSLPQAGQPAEAERHSQTALTPFLNYSSLGQEGLVEHAGRAKAGGRGMAGMPACYLEEAA